MDTDLFPNEMPTVGERQLDSDANYSRPQRVWTSPLQRIEQTITYDRRYVGQLVAPKQWSPCLDVTMLKGGSHLRQPKRWQPSNEVSAALPARLAESFVTSKTVSRTVSDQVAALEAQAALWEAEAELKALAGEAEAARKVQEAVEKDHTDWWAWYERGRE